MTQILSLFFKFGGGVPPVNLTGPPLLWSPDGTYPLAWSPEDTWPLAWSPEDTFPLLWSPGMAVQGPDIYVARGTTWSRQFNLAQGATGQPSDITLWDIRGTLRSNWQPAVSDFTITSTATFPPGANIDPLCPFIISFTSSQLMLPTADELTAFQANNGPGATLPNFTYYFDVWRVDVLEQLFKAKFIITPAAFQ